ncbi:NUDIX hydrolase [Micromonospora haikouensis]|uniref:NUDIX hydrolase n=1 Tax=Micromonospora haikouensis TaxID=686309 RepID=UPI0037970C0F
MTAKPTIAALAVVTTASGKVVFVRQQRGPYAGWLLLPGGKVEFGESAQDAAGRETVEEAGFEVGELTPTGVYEIRAKDGTYHFVMFAFRAETATRVADGGHHVDGVIQASVDEVQPHPTVMRILNDAGVGRYTAQDIEEGLRRDGILMRGHLTTTAGALV